jgi:hypothetical protein
MGCVLGVCNWGSVNEVVNSGYKGTRQALWSQKIGIIKVTGMVFICPEKQVGRCCVGTVFPHEQDRPVMTHEDDNARTPRQNLHFPLPFRITCLHMLRISKWELVQKS